MIAPARLALAEGLAVRIARWARALGADDAAAAALQRATLALGLANADGHVCLPLAELLPDTTDPRDQDTALDALRRALRASPLVGDADAIERADAGTPLTTPLVLDDGDRLYLARDFDHERRLAARLARAAAAPPAPIAPATAALLHELFDGPRDGEPDWQQVAAALALRRRLVVISGGPGTGKTTTVVKLLACLLAAEPDCRIALAAPTGKAAARMSQALRERAAALPPALRAWLPAEASTVHRLLGVRPGPDRFAHHAGQPLALDALVVDEASMLDLALARRLLEAVPEHARIVLLGDKDQLAAVESGAVFAELSADPTLSAATREALAAVCGVTPAALRVRSPAAMRVVTPESLATPGTARTEARASPLQDCAVWFARTHRFQPGSGIARLAAAINAGRAPETLATLRDAAAGGDLQWLDDAGEPPSSAPGPRVWQTMTEGIAPYLDAVLRHPQDPAAVARAWGGFVVLTALRGGARGQQAINERLERHARRHLGTLPAADGRAPWWPGRPVMVLHNDPVLRLFNGDIGFVLPDSRGVLQAWFPVASGESAAPAASAEEDEAGAEGRWRAVPPLRLPPHQTAFAMTVHKAQGSEFDRVLLLLPAQAGRVLTRELLYTGVTRAREAVVVCGSEDVVADAVAAPTRRRSGLLARLHGMVVVR
ncbi:MAG: exodeoxyribonuclease V subunit alpha [Burkholderiaceae bacterium]|nr:exodeoxyribonuclease V subunit alpha [Burkholderiaceae bacterium]